MSPRFVVSGTDTGIGKTIFAAGLAGALDAKYWKPVQSGLEEETDSEVVARLSGLPADRILPESYRLNTPASPHLSARIDGIEIDPDQLAPPEGAGPLVIEGAGGLLVPLTEKIVFADVFARWKIPVILCARTSLGTINHTLLSIEALRNRAIPIAGVAFVGAKNEESQTIIAAIAQVKILGRLPILETVTRDTLRRAFSENFDVASLVEMSS